ncbi:MAG: prepilin-type N-terminal cleavage/methylation domain-containing protein [Omnitrophica bacterium]|nr:prepilin-type N-terminal cleavage/methylation domain-containing protein [Candidatus Omnitrophota bacterium]
MKKKTLSGRGFTLIELLVTAAILGIISMAVVSTFAAGLKVYEKARDYSWERVDALLALEKMERDILNLVNFSGIDFVGGKETISFAGLTKEGEPGKIRYYMKGGMRGVLIREELGYARAISKTSRRRGERKELATLRDMDFEYYYYDNDTKKYLWKDKWKLNEEEKEDLEKSEWIPIGVRVKIKFKEGKRYVTLTRSVLIPISSRGPLIKG